MTVDLTVKKRSQTHDMASKDLFVPVDSPRIQLRLLNRNVVITAESDAILATIRRWFDFAFPIIDRLDSPDLRIHLRKTSPAQESPWIIESNPRLGCKDSPPSRVDVVEYLIKHLHEWIISVAHEYHVFHAAAVALGNLGVLLPGPSRAGKSTLTAALARGGLAVLSDEVGAVRLVDDKLVHYPRVLCIRQDVMSLFGLGGRTDLLCGRSRPALVAAEHLGGTRVPDARFSAIIVPRWRAGTSIKIKPLNKRNTLLLLEKASCALSGNQTSRIERLIEWVNTLPSFQLTFEKLDYAVEAVSKIVSDET